MLPRACCINGSVRRVLPGNGLAAVQAFFHQVFKQDQDPGVKVVGGQVAVIQDVVVQQDEGKVGVLGDGRALRPRKGGDLDVVPPGVGHQFQDRVGGTALADDDHQPGVQGVGFIDFVAVGADGG